VEGEAHKVTGPPTIAAMAALWDSEGWPARVDDTGWALTAEYTAPSARPPPGPCTASHHNGRLQLRRSSRAARRVGALGAGPDRKSPIVASSAVGIIGGTDFAARVTFSRWARRRAERIGRVCLARKGSVRDLSRIGVR
jgi:hypothetical protein